jgi:hypothetical protein
MNKAGNFCLKPDLHKRAQDMKRKKKRVRATNLTFNVFYITGED